MNSDKFSKELRHFVDIPWFIGNNVFILQTVAFGVKASSSYQFSAIVSLFFSKLWSAAYLRVIFTNFIQSVARKNVYTKSNPESYASLTWIALQSCSTHFSLFQSQENFVTIGPGTNFVHHFKPVVCFVAVYCCSLSLRRLLYLLPMKQLIIKKKKYCFYTVNEPTKVAGDQSGNF